MAGVGSIYTLHSKGSMIEGIGDEVLLGLVSTLVLIAIVSIIFRNHVGIRNIHPLQEEQVRLARDRLGVGREDDSEEHQSEHISEPPRPFSVERHCPVCLTDARYLTMTNCGHEFCAPCIISYWRYGRWLGAVQCPVCRQKVTILFKNFSPEENESSESEQWKREILEYNRRFSGLPRSLMDYIRDFPTLLRQLLSELFSVGGLVWVLRMRIILCFLAAALYFVSPLDIIPESVFGFLGLLDDFLIVLLLLVYVTEAYRQYVANRATA
ncbi:E3 ubiquitin-protein ligase RNF170 [Exaiptasia diaphana]|uniref:E3 ubiquitin-protein ligase RNF170 n=1 Tax=Exaiptasia diaphana TaxID=2652724 RepID=A0A913Y6X5_EXADI|nr:E3 ubiquitin-protein ligase RNF170 [Exaiptasia diaphana]XP_020915768.1 E3 ubiquitin-protein ligase RNF170 [Exaiptasia diaphana]KXJ21914.1 E3 ubiquitin-protein ligase RNF170 [Exaiptasia diaphana]KXJ21926.1 E3 ubiquitin-protein ligase RNF170 [Exaiptasia diaphana]